MRLIIKKLKMILYIFMNWAILLYRAIPCFSTIPSVLFAMVSEHAITLCRRNVLLFFTYYVIYIKEKLI